MATGTQACLVATDSNFNLYLGEAAPAAFVPSQDHGLINFGPGPWDGASAGKFVGRTANGTGMAANYAAGFSGDMASWQIAGVNRFTFTGATLYLGKVGAAAGTLVFGDWNDTNTSQIHDIGGDPLQYSAQYQHMFQTTTAGDVPFLYQSPTTATEDVVRYRLANGNLLFGVGSNGSNGQPHRFLVRRTSDSRSMAQTHTLGAYSGRAIEVLDDLNASLGFIPIYA